MKNVLFPTTSEQRRQEAERQRVQAEVETRRKVRERRPTPASNYGSSSSYIPATDYSPAFVPAADVYSPAPSPASSSSDSYSGGGGSFDGGGASGDY